VHSFIECDSQSHSISNYILISLAKWLKLTLRSHQK
jgi:hypothetical protein